MVKTEILKDADFEEITEARIDSKHRIALGRTVPREVRSFRMYRNAHGQVILDPMVSIPASEAWLFKNKRAAALVQQGIDEARQGRLIKAKEDFSKHLKHHN